MPTGTVARLVLDRGFGFIRSDAAPVDLFFHRSSVRDAVFELLAEGQRVEFTSQASTKGPRANDVRRIRVMLTVTDSIPVIDSEVRARSGAGGEVLLARAVIAMAVSDLRDRPGPRRVDADVFLRSRIFDFWCEIARLDPAAVRDAVARLPAKLVATP